MADVARPRKTPIDAKGRAEARRLFEQTDLLNAEIARHVGVTPPSLRAMARNGAWVRGPAVQRSEAVRKIRARVEDEIGAVEAALAAADGAAVETVDRAARVLASLVKSLRELQKYDAESRASGAGDGEDNEPPADIDALRDALADRLERLRQGDA